MLRYSARLKWSAPQNPFSLLLAKKRASGDRLLDLTVSNPTQALDNYPHADIAKAYGAVDDFVYHPDPLGNLAAREEIAAWYAGKGLPLNASQLALTSSTSEGYGLLFKLLVNSGEEVLIPTPSYPLFEYLAQLEGVVLRPYRLRYDGVWHVDFESLEAAISTRTRALIVVNPNNPTGSFLKRDEVERLEAIALKHNLPIIADEVFMDYCLAPSAEQVPTFTGRNRTLSLSLNGLSKSAGMPQMKLGWIAVNGQPQECADAMERLELLLDTYLSVATPVQNALGPLLQVGGGIQRQICDQLRRNKKTLDSISEKSSIHALHCEGGWSAAVRVPSVWSEETWITRLLQESLVVAHPGYFFDMPMDGCLLVSLLTEPAVFAEGVERMEALARTI